MAELYAIGQIIGANKFPKSSLFCKWGLSAGSGWKLIEGCVEGQTQIDSPDFDDFTYWCHPIDVHYATKGIQGWPKLHVQVYHYDQYGRSELCGYGVCHLPTSPGTHCLECCTWRPIGTYKEEFQQYFLGGGVQLQDPELVYSGCNRYKLHTQTMGTVYLEISIILRNFEKFGIERGACEINCCCDVDCTVDQRVVFTHCENIPLSVDREHCFPQQLAYHNNTEVRTTEIEPGLLCVIHQNIELSTDFEDVPVLKTVAELEKKLGHRKVFSWANIQPAAPVFDEGIPYGDGSPIWVSDNVTIRSLTFPAAVGYGSMCTSFITPSYLQETTTSCTIRVRDEKDCLNLKPSLFSVISSPSDFNFTQVQDCTDVVCLPIQKYLCHNSCAEGALIQPSYNTKLNICQNFIKTVEYKIYHNGSQGITEFKAFYTVTNISANKENLFRTSYKVSYAWVGETDHPLLRRSGHPGYELGKPVISGRKRRNIIHLNSSSAEWISVGLAGTDGKCSNRYNLVFGENLRTQCLLPVNGTCDKIQQQVWHQILGAAANLSETVISSYGDPQEAEITAWVPLLKDESPEFTTAVEIIIVHSLVGPKSSPQAKIIGAYLRSIPIGFICHSNLTSLMVETSVRYIDKTTPAITKFAQPPVYEIKLPQDFFYPFLSKGCKRDFTWIFCAYILILFILH